MVGSSETDQLRQQLFIRGKSIFHGSDFRIGQGNILSQPQQVGFAFEKLGLRRFLWQIKRALRARHAVRTLIEEIIRAVAVPEIVKLPRLGSSGAAPDQLLIDKYFDGAQVSCEVAGIRIRLG